jgi:hypothetical protein
MKAIPENLINKIFQIEEVNYKIIEIKYITREGKIQMIVFADSGLAACSIDTITETHIRCFTIVMGELVKFSLEIDKLIKLIVP